MRDRGTGLCRINRRAANILYRGYGTHLNFLGTERGQGNNAKLLRHNINPPSLTSTWLSVRIVSIRISGKTEGEDRKEGRGDGFLVMIGTM